MEQERKLSEKENKLLEFIKNSIKEVSAIVIKDELGESYLGVLGRLVKLDMVEKVTKYQGDVSNPYGRTRIKCYVIKKEEIK